MANNQRIYNSLFHFIKSIIDERITTINNLCLLMTGIFLSHTVHLSEIADELPVGGTSDSLVQRMRRSLKNDKIDDEVMYSPISVAYRGRAVPLIWKVINKAGATDAVTQIEFFEHLVPLIPKGVEIVLAGDGEFRSTQFIGWLYTKGAHYRLRVAKDTYIRDKYDEEVQLQDLRLRKGETLFLQGIFITKDDPTGPVNLAMTWKEGEDEPWYIVTDQPANWGTLTDYKVRMWIEEMHGDLKGNGLHLDQNRISLAYPATCSGTPSPCRSQTLLPDPSTKYDSVEHARAFMG